MSLVLSEQEIRATTGCVHHDAQLKELTYLGIPWKQRRDGSLVVVRADFLPQNGEKKAKEPQLRLSA